MSRTSAVIDSAIIVFREGLETILVLAAVTASFLGADRVKRNPVGEIPRVQRDRRGALGGHMDERWLFRR